MTNLISVPQHMSLPNPESVVAAARRIGAIVRRTRLHRAAGVWLKLENEQLTGSFKLRGATNVIAGLGDEDRARGVVASSAGNHGLGVAWAARHFSIPATVFIPASAPRVKREGIAALGATVVDNEPHYDAAHVAALRYSAENTSRFINPCLGDDLLAGQGTVALEVLEEVPDLQTFVVSVGGGGLLGGCAALLRARAPRARIIGVQTENTDAMARSLAAKRIVEVDYLPTLADGLAGQVDDAAFAIGQEALDDIVTVSEQQLGEAMLWLLDEHGLRAEGAGAVGVAAVLAGRLNPRGETVVVVSGGNVDDERLAQLRRGSGQQ